ncbi:hypothetical protein JB92DRAFT_1615771 [Gautieria morchelliformis]|nr:hypothetical protein JB92DRAFT_1615771 [Gautieria morchelliformis]
MSAMGAVGEAPMDADLDIIITRGLEDFQTRIRVSQGLLCLHLQTMVNRRTAVGIVNSLYDKFLTMLPATSQAHVDSISTPADGSVRATLSRRSSKKSSLGRTSDLEPVSEMPAPSRSSSIGRSSSAESQTDPALRHMLDHPVSDDEDEFDPELLGLSPAVSSSQELTWTSSLSRASYNARPSYSQYPPNPRDSEDCFFGTQPDLSPLTSSFPPPEKPAAFHLPQPSVYRPSRSASVSDTPSADTPSLTQASEQSHSSGSLSSSANSSLPVTPMSPALADIVDAVAKIAVATPSPDWRLLRQPSLHSINEHASYDDPRTSVDSEQQSLSNFPIPPQSILAAKHQLPKIKTSLSNISEVENTRKQDWLRVNTAIADSHSPGGSLSSLDLSMSPRSLSGRSSFDRLSSSDRRSSMTPVPHSGGGLARLLSPKRSSSRLEKDVAKARSKADKLELKLRELEEKELHKQDQSDRQSTQYLSGLWLPKSPKTSKSDDKKRKKELEKQKLKGIADEAKLRADNRGFQPAAAGGKYAEKWALSGVGGL